MKIPLETALAFVEDHHRAVLLTHKSQGGMQMSPVVAGVDAERLLIVSTRRKTAKVANIRRDRRVSLLVLGDGFFGPWVQLDGEAFLLEGPDAIEALVDYYKRVAGEHPDWDRYRQAMVEEDRLLIRIRAEAAAGPAALQ